MSRDALAQIRRQSPLRHVPRQSRSEATVEFVLEAARRVVDEAGVGGATMTRIAEVAGVSVGSLYQYFRDKQAMLQALTEQELLRAESELTVAQAPSADLRSDLRAMIGAIARYYARSERLRELVLEARRPLLSSATLARRRERLDALVQHHGAAPSSLATRSLVAATFIEEVAVNLLDAGSASDAQALSADVAAILERFLRAPRTCSRRTGSPTWRGRHARTRADQATALRAR